MHAGRAQHVAQRRQQRAHHGGRRRGMVFQRGAGDRHERHHERVHAGRDQPLAAAQNILGRVAQAGQDVGADLAPAEHLHRARERVEIALQRHAGLARHDAGPHGRRDRFQVHPQRIDAGVAHARKPRIVVRWLALALDRQGHRRLDRERALAQDGGATVGGVRRAGGHHHMLHIVQQHGRAGHFGQLFRRLAQDGAAGRQRLPDRAELARLAPALIADAALQHRGGQHVLAVQRGDLRIRHAVERLHLVKARLARERDDAHRAAVAQDGAAPVGAGRGGQVRRIEGAAGMHRDHDGGAVDDHRLVVGRAGAAAPAGRTLAGVRQAHAQRLQFGDQLLGRQIGIEGIHADGSLGVVGCKT